jgi:hypothetical protein
VVLILRVSFGCEVLFLALFFITVYYCHSSSLGEAIVLYALVLVRPLALVVLATQLNDSVDRPNEIF